MLRYLIIVGTAFLVGCAGTEDRAGTGENPSEHCRRLGLQDGSETFNACVTDYINQYCLGQGLQPGTAEYGECERSLREASFLRQQLQMRGF